MHIDEDNIMPILLAGTIMLLGIVGIIVNFDDIWVAIGFMVVGILIIISVTSTKKTCHDDDSPIGELTGKKETDEISRSEKEIDVVRDYEKGNIIGIWLNNERIPLDPNQVDYQLIYFLLPQEVPENYRHAIVDKRFRVVRNKYNDRGGSFLMFDGHKAPGEQTANSDRCSSSNYHKELEDIKKRILSGNDTDMTLEEILIAGSINGDIEKINAALDAGADIDTQPQGLNFGMSPLMHATSQGHLEAVKYLVLRGAKVDLLSTPYSQSALYMAADKNNVEVAEFLIESGAGYIDQILEAVKSKQFDIAKPEIIELLERHVNG